MDATVSVKPVETTTTPRLGIFFGLEAEEYHDDDALGSTAVRDLLKGPMPYWYRSKMNPRRPKRRDTEATIYGTAVHKLLLEGEEAFDRVYSRRPDDEDGASPADKSKITKTHNERCRSMGMIGLHGDDYDRCAIARAMISLDPDLVDVFKNAFFEVSVFWNEDVTNADGEVVPVRCKMRTDVLKARVIADVKNVTNIFKDDFVEACWHAQEKLRLDVQAELYLRGRRAMPALFKADRVYGLGVPLADFNERRALLDKIIATKCEGWQWIFYAAGENDPPEVLSETLRYGNDILKVARDDVDLALARFVEWRARFGEAMWVRREGVKEADMSHYSARYGRATRRPT